MSAVSPSTSHDNNQEATDEWELVEVGKGMANYNSWEIDKVKGLKRSAFFSDRIPFV